MFQNFRSTVCYNLHFPAGKNSVRFQLKQYTGQNVVTFSTQTFIRKVQEYSYSNLNTPLLL